jgi:hypothetical protein
VSELRALLHSVRTTLRTARTCISVLSRMNEQRRRGGSARGKRAGVSNDHGAATGGSRVAAHSAALHGCTVETAQREHRLTGQCLLPPRRVPPAPSQPRAGRTDAPLRRTQRFGSQDVVVQKEVRKVLGRMETHGMEVRASLLQRSRFSCHSTPNVVVVPTGG